jgi:hypothetical protein
LAVLKRDLEKSIEVVEHKLTATLERGLRSQTRWFVLGNIGTVVVLAGYFSTVR